MTFEQTPEYQQSMRMRGACDRVICHVFGVTPDRIERFDKSGDLFVLDKEFAIDMRVRLQNDSQITGQEKTLSYQFYKYRTFTIEFWQNRFTREPGEFFHIASQFYLHGYSDQTGTHFEEWIILDILEFMHYLRRNSIDDLASRTRPAGGSRAAFLPIPYDNIPPQFIKARGERKTRTVINEFIEMN
ncbi:MAG: hypothetical protein GX465_16480 [Acidobacteria bacterium]|nr:hypothetical protein [Acidobacteriota bacterium]